MRRIVFSAALAIIPAFAGAGETAVQLKQDAGVEVVEAQCGACHSLDYIVMNSPFLDGAKWDAEIAKMINAFGAPISPEDAKTIGEYLKRNYGERGARAGSGAAD
jgi:sulfite dehydrogenase (cytochrome) subunit B